MKPHLIRLQYFAWLIVPTVAYLAYLILGWPHVLFTWTDRMPRSMSSCSYLGPTGIFETYAKVDGHCQLLRFRKSEAVSQ